MVQPVFHAVVPKNFRPRTLWSTHARSQAGEGLSRDNKTTVHHELAILRDMRKPARIISIPWAARTRKAAVVECNHPLVQRRESEEVTVSTSRLRASDIRQ
jgi:hypothetical protein